MQINPKQIWQIYRQMGGKYFLFRSVYEVKRRTGRLKKDYPTNPPVKAFISLEEWRKNTPLFFIDPKEELQIPRRKDEALAGRIAAFKKGKLTYFNGEEFDLGPDYNWITNPLTGYAYQRDQHWTEVEDFTDEAGDIKYVWEKSRFLYFYDLIRYDYHYQEDMSEMVWSEIESWMDFNPINCGPNFKCSQEMSLRSLNWLFALYYYKNAPSLTEERFQRIMHFIYWQLKHVRANIQFSLISVRNNHAITETVTLLMAGYLFPFFPEAKAWSKKGRAWLEQEIDFQIYEDGSNLQYSHNYHRVVLQTLTWPLYLTEKNKAPLSPKAQDRIRKSLDFMLALQVEETGALPNYGLNDGSIFFPLNGCAYRDYRPQLNALYYYFHKKHLYPEGPWREDTEWFNGGEVPAELADRNKTFGSFEFKVGGYYVLRKPDSLFCIRCGNHDSRPAQADNLHVDIWYKGSNILLDAGTYRYNTDRKFQLYFNGSQSHNVAMLKDHDQMEKGPRFIWFHWTQAEDAKWSETDDAWIFSGKITAFRQLGDAHFYKREVRISKEEAKWEIRDELIHDTGLPMQQYWHPGPDFESQGFTIEALDADNNTLAARQIEGWFSNTYGVKEPLPGIYFESPGKVITTQIKIST